VLVNPRVVVAVSDVEVVLVSVKVVVEARSMLDPAVTLNCVTGVKVNELEVVNP
jgi:hypothetical protein